MLAAQDTGAGGHVQLWGQRSCCPERSARHAWQPLALARCHVLFKQLSIFNRENLTQSGIADQNSDACFLRNSSFVNLKFI